MMVRRNLAVTLLASATVVLGGCSLLGASDEEKALEVATSDEAMWYRFTFEAEYKGKPFKIEQMVNCTRSVQSGGSLGQSPDTHIHEGYPRTAAAKMADDSQVLVRIPNMCNRNRNYELQPNTSGVNFLPGWRSRGPHEIIPLVIWSDNPAKPERIESYVARAYYAQPEARIKNPKGFVDLWPVGNYPKIAKAILATEEPIPYYPHPNKNPKLDPNARSKGNDGSYHGDGPRFMYSAIIPMSDPVAGWKKYGEAANRSIADWTRKKGPPLDYEPREDENFVVYRDAPYRDIVGEYGPDASYVWGKCIRDSIADLMVGDPVMVGQTLDQNILGETSINPRTPGTEAYRAGWLEDVEIREQKKRNCWTQLDKLRSFEIVDGRFDASRSLPGVIIYGRWGIDPFPTSSGNAGPYSALKNKNMIDRYGVMFRLNGKPLKVQPLNEYYIKDKKSGNWYYFESIGPGFFGGGGEGSAVG